MCVVHRLSNPLILLIIGRALFHSLYLSTSNIVTLCCRVVVCASASTSAGPQVVVCSCLLCSSWSPVCRAVRCVCVCVVFCVWSAFAVFHSSHHPIRSGPPPPHLLPTKQHQHHRTCSLTSAPIATPSALCLEGVLHFTPAGPNRVSFLICLFPFFLSPSAPAQCDHRDNDTAQM